MTINHVLPDVSSTSFLFIGGSGVETGFDPKYHEEVSKGKGNSLSVSGTGLNYLDMIKILEYLVRSGKGRKIDSIAIELSQVLLSPKYIKVSQSYNRFSDINFDRIGQAKLGDYLPLFYWRDLIRIGIQYQMGLIDYKYPEHIIKSVDEKKLRKHWRRVLNSPSEYKGHTPFFRTAYHYQNNLQKKNFIRCEKQIFNFENTGTLDLEENKNIIDQVLLLSKKLSKNITWVEFPKTNETKSQRSHSLRNYIQEKGEKIVDLTKDSDKMLKQAQFIDCMHFNDKGRRNLTEKLYEQSKLEK